RGSVWAPTAYMTLKGLDAVGKFDLAHKLAMNHHGNVVKVFNDTGTVWENYAPDFVERGSASSPDFVGWSGLPPIAVLLEYVMGIIPDGMNKSITWHVNLTERHGVKKYPLGTEAELDLICEARKSEDERPVVTVNSNIPVTVKVVWKGGEYEIRT
ncbi:MAG: glycoside hydrolase, partial [Clostridia bacterium]|nr:glycoside hydrolase [Clostridia bacterium]